MKSSMLYFGLLILAFGLILSLPSLVLEASGSRIKDTGQAINFITGNFIKGLSTTISKPTSLFNMIPTVLILIGLILIIIYLFFRFFVI